MSEAQYEVGELINSILNSAAHEVVDCDDAAFDAAVDSAWELRFTKLEFMRFCAEAVDGLGTFDCVWCGVDTWEIREYYMVQDSLWKEFGPVHGKLCIGCLEDRLGRELVPADFTDCRINQPHQQHSDRLRERLGLVG